VRLSFLLSDIAQLAKKYPPARQALEDRRAAALRKLEDEDAGTTGALRAATELHALDRELEQPERTLADFDRLRSAGKLSADEEKCLRFQLVHQLTEKRRYGEVLQSCGGDAQKRVDAELKQSQAMKAFAKQHNPDLAAMEDDTDHEFVVERCTDFYEAELGAGSPDKAREIAMKLTLFHPKGSTYAALIDCSVHAERFDAARKLADDAKAALDAEELAAVNSAAAKIPPK
jgi:hypothetical protein